MFFLLQGMFGGIGHGIDGRDGIGDAIVPLKARMGRAAMAEKFSLKKSNHRGPEPSRRLIIGIVTLSYRIKGIVGSAPR